MIFMKKLFVLFSAATFVLFSCSSDDNPSKDDGEEQVPQPVENSGANTEGERAVEATVNDSTKSDTKKDTTK
jgi:hypothetical protein